MNKFRSRYYDEYLLSLREYGRDLYDGNWENSIKVGDVVLIGSEVKIRPHWSLARVVELLPGQDGKVRTVKLKKPDRSEGIYTINKLYPLELSISDFFPKNLENGSRNNVEESRSPRPKRKAAEKCSKLLKKSI